MTKSIYISSLYNLEGRERTCGIPLLRDTKILQTQKAWGMILWVKKYIYNRTSKNLKRKLG